MLGLGVGQGLGGKVMAVVGREKVRARAESLVSEGVREEEEEGSRILRGSSHCHTQPLCDDEGLSEGFLEGKGG